MSSQTPSFDFSPAERVQPFYEPTVWHEFTPLAVQHKSINLGQGFPNWECPKFVKESLKKAVSKDIVQYTRSLGHPALVEQLAKHYSPVFNRELNQNTDIFVSVGASEALYAAIQAFVNKGDEVVIIEPAFDIYIAQSVIAGGKPVYVPLRPTEDGESWKLDMDEFAAAFTDKTKLVILNTPQNPTGKLFTEEELTQIANIVKAHPRAIVLADEVYEHMIYDGKKMARIANVPGMWERTVSISSAGKTFSVTGFKIGWCVGPAPLIEAIGVVHQWVAFCASSTLQQAIADSLVAANEPYEKHETYYKYLTKQYTKKRENLVSILKENGLKPMVPEGGFFIMADISGVELPKEYLTPGTPRDYAFCRWLTKEVGVTAIPPTAFYCEEHKHLGENYARFAFCKTDDALDEAYRRLAAHDSLGGLWKK